jgi:dienelactone hydrolase
MRDQDLLLETHGPFGSGVIGVCDVCGKRQAVIVLKKERFKLCVIDFLNKTWNVGDPTPGVPLPPYVSERIWFESDFSSTGKASAILLTPTKIVRHPIVLVTPDVFGLTTQVLDAAIHCAREGFEVLIPDVGKSSVVGPADHLSMRLAARFRGGVPMQSKRTRHLIQFYRDAMEHLRARPMVDPEKSAVVGLSYGGSLAIAYAAEDQRLSAVALAYPMPISPPEYLRLLTAPVLLVSPWHDRAANRSRKMFQSAQKEFNLNVEFAEYVPVGHGFLARDLRQYDMTVAESAWERIGQFLRVRLLPPPPKPPAPPHVVLPAAATVKPATPASGPTAPANPAPERSAAPPTPPVAPPAQAQPGSG